MIRRRTTAALGLIAAITVGAAACGPTDTEDNTEIEPVEDEEEVGEIQEDVDE